MSYYPNNPAQKKHYPPPDCNLPNVMNKELNIVFNLQQTDSWHKCRQTSTKKSQNLFVNILGLTNDKHYKISYILINEIKCNVLTPLHKPLCSTSSSDPIYHNCLSPLLSCSLSLVGFAFSSTHHPVNYLFQKRRHTS